MSTNNLYDFIDAGYRIFGLHGGTPEGACKCGNPLCEAAYKHPVSSNWQHTPQWSEDQIEGFEAMGTFRTGYGVLMFSREKDHNLLVVDVDARNGGVKSLANLCKDLHGLDIARSAGLTVATGSGQGSMHIYFRAPAGVSLVQGHPKYKGIDFKSSGFVVGPGSMHVSGNTYEVIHGSPAEIGDPPAELIELLKRPDSFRAEMDGSTVDVTLEELADMLSYVDFDSDRATWLACGMAIHEATGGTGFDVWDAWSAKGEKYPGRVKLSNQWERFGKAANPVRIGTLVHHAKEGGWDSMLSVTPEGMEFMLEEPAPKATEVEEVVENGKKKVRVVGNVEPPFHTNGIDLLRPPGFVGDVCQWINECSRAPRENLAVAAALVGISNVIGLRFTDDYSGVTSNLFCMCVAGSATGKEAILEAVAKIHMAAGIQGATVGTIKSEQEIFRNLIHHQMSAYLIDEFGILLKTITSSKEAYHSGVIGTLMNAYSKANSFMPIGGDVRRDVVKTLVAERRAALQKIEDNEDPDGWFQKKHDSLTRALESIENGIEKPFLSMMGFTTPETFESLVTREQATNGFIGRSIIIQELETNPRNKVGFKAKPMSDYLKLGILGLHDAGHHEVGAKRIEFYGERTAIRSTAEAREMLDAVQNWQWLLAEHHKEATGLEALARRSFEMVCKISLVLAAPGGLRTAEHVRWAFKFVERDINFKTMLALGNDEGGSVAQAISAKVRQYARDEGEKLSVIINRVARGKFKKDDVLAVIKKMVEQGLIVQELAAHPVTGKEVPMLRAMPES